MYGASILKDCYKISAEKHGVKIRGYIGNQNFSKPNKTYQSVFLNGRYIVNSTISAAVSNAYASYLMKRQYPFYVLYIDVPAEVVDVNVHPNKADVRFIDNQVIYGCIYSVISSVLDGNPKALDYLASGSVPAVQSVAEPDFSAGLPSGKAAPVQDEPQSRPVPRANAERPMVSAPVRDGRAKGFTSALYEEAKREIEKATPRTPSAGKELPFETEERKNPPVAPNGEKEKRVSETLIPIYF